MRIFREKVKEPEDKNLYEVSYISYVMKPEYYYINHWTLLHVRDTNEQAMKDVRSYQHVGKTKIEEKLTRVVFRSDRTEVCKPL